MANENDRKDSGMGRIFGIGLGVLVAGAILANVKDIVRYIKISSM